MVEHPKPSMGSLCMAAEKIVHQDLKSDRLGEAESPLADTQAKDGLPPCNFEAHGKRFLYARKSLFLLSPDNSFRKHVVWLITWAPFDNTILLLIFLNSIVLAMTDYGSVHSSGALQGELSSDSWRNALVENSDPFFTAAFTIECLAKIVGMGFIFQKKSYLRDAWNWLDFIVVIAALLAAVPGIPKLSALRVIRVLRPLKSLNAVPGMKKMVGSLLKSIPELVSVMQFLAFLFFIFGILGIQFWSGQLHSRCRMTAHPLVLPEGEVWPLSDSYLLTVKNASRKCWVDKDCADLEAMYCRDASGAVIDNDDGSWTHDSSPWHKPHRCIWPVDPDEPHRICSLSGTGGYSECPNYEYTPATEDKPHGWCGSNFDDHGNPRFTHPDAETAEKIMKGPTYYDDLLFGYLNFDNMATAFLTIFQCITMEGWTDIMYQLQDSWSGVVTALYFVFLILFGSFFLLNLTLAVIWDNFADAKEQEDLEKQKKLEEKQKLMEEEKQKRREKRFKNKHEHNHANAGDNSPDANAAANADASPAPHGHSHHDIGSILSRRFSTGRMSFDSEVDFDHMTTRELTLHVKWDGPIRQKCHDLAVWPAFEMFIMACILTNTLTLAMNKHPMSVELNDNLEIVNFVLTIIFTLETIVKLVGLGVKLWNEDRFNQFDGFIVLVSLIELGVGPPAFLTGAVSDPNEEGGALSALRTFRLFRVFKLARSWTSLQNLLLTIAKTMDEIGNFSVLLGLFMYIYALVGMQFFAYKFRFDDDGYAVDRFDPGYLDAELPRAHFDDLLWSLVTIFQILTGENWNTVMYDGWRATGWFAVFYFVSLVVLGSFIVLNLFLAILLGNFEGGDDDDEEEEKKGETDLLLSGPKETGFLGRIKSLLGLSSKVAPMPSDEDADADADADASSSEETQTQAKNTNTNKKVSSEDPDEKEGKAVPVPVPVVPAPPGVAFGILGPKSEFRIACFKFYHNPRFEHVILSLIVISSITLAIDNPLWSQESTQVKVLAVLDIIFSVCFSIEMVVKIIALGFLFHKGAYLRDSWNILDFLIVIISWLSIISSGDSSLSALRSLRTFRALRPLRMISRNPGLKLVVNALFASIPEIINVLLVCLLFFMIFAIVGVNYFKGRFMHCVITDESHADGDAILNMLTYPRLYSQWDSGNQALFDKYVNSTKFDGYSAFVAYTANTNTTTTAGVGGAAMAAMVPTSQIICESLNTGMASWEANVPQNFNNALNGCLLLFEMSTTEQWVDMMYAGVDATGIGMQPIRDHNPAFVFFFVAFMIVGSFFVMQLFVGVVIDNFNKMKEELGEGEMLLMTEAQSEWARMQKQVMKFKPIKRVRLPGALPFCPKFVRVACYHFVRRPWFDHFIMGCIIVNSLVMAMKYFGANDTYEFALQVINFTFGAIFTVEAVMKLLGLGTQYWSDNWNIFDFTIVCGTLLGILLKYAAGIDVGSIATVIRTFRVGRIFRLIKSAPTLRKLFSTLVVTLPSLVNIGLLLGLLFFIYAILGVQLYAKVRFGGSLGPNSNFQTITGAILLLLRSSTGENWNGLMYDCALSDGTCTPASDMEFDSNVCGFSDKIGCVPINGCGDPVTPFIYFISFTLFVTFIMLNVFIAVILEGFSTEKENFHMKLNDDQCEAFCKQWFKYDQEGSGLMEFSKLSMFIQNLDPPMGFADTTNVTKSDIERRISDLRSRGKGIRILAKNVGGKSVRAVGFYDVAHHLALRIVREIAKEKKEQWEEVDLDEQSATVDKRLAIDKVAEKEMSESNLDMGHCYAALSVYSAYRNHALCHRIQEKIAERALLMQLKNGDGLDPSGSGSRNTTKKSTAAEPAVEEEVQEI